MAYRDTILSRSPVEYWEFNEASGTTADSVGSGNHDATVTGATVTGGIKGNARLFDGVDDIVTATSVADFMAQTAYTVEAWFKWDDSSKDYPTLVRRDGNGKTFILRGRKGTLGDRPGAIEVYISGKGVDTGATKFNDGQWHHVVATKSSTTVRLFVDNVEYTTGSGTLSTGGSGLTATYIGSNSGSTVEQFKGAIDEVAIYHTALTPTQVGENYSAGKNGGYTAEVMTASADMPGGNGRGALQTITPVADTYVEAANGANTGVNYSTSTDLRVRYTSAGVYIDRTYIDFGTPSFATIPDENIVNAKLRLYRPTGAQDTATFRLARITSAWNAATMTYSSGQPTNVTVFENSLTVPAGPGWFEIDVTDLVLEWAAGTPNYGVKLDIWTGSDDFSFSSSEATNKPQLAVQYAVTAHVAPTVTPMTADATMPNASVATAANAQYGAQAMGATASMPNAVASSEQFIDLAVEAESMDAYATWPTATGFTLNPTMAAEPFAASAETVDAAVSTQRGPKIAAEPFKANSVWKQPSAVNGNAILASEVDDKFFQRVWDAVPSVWYRLNDSGSEAINRMAPTGAKGYYEGVQTGQFNAPDGRHSVYFDGTARIRQDEPLSAEAGSANSTLVFSFRTTKANEFLMVTADPRAATNANTPVAPRELFLNNGRIGYRSYSYVNGVVANPTEFLGFRNLADGEWHTVVIRSTDTAQVTNNFVDGVEIYIDGKFEVRRAAAARWTGFPDYIGGRPDTINSGPLGNTDRVVMPALPSSQNFVGDMTEVVFFNDTLGAHEIGRIYYDFMGWTPIEATSMDAFAFTPADTHGRGNQKRALYLWWDREVDSYWVAGSGAGVGANDPAHNAMNFDPVLDGHGAYGTYDLEGYKVFARSVTSQTNGLPYRDVVYDQPGLINLETDVDLKDYDVIMFGDWPDEGYEDDRLRNTIPNYTAEKERLISQLWEANAKGVGLNITHPRLAVDMGYIDRVEFVSTLKESKTNGLQGNAAGMYDYGSAVKFPWNITADAALASGPAGAAGTGEAMNTDPAYLSSKAFYYEDMNFNNKFRIRATVEGLTDIPSYMIKDAVYHRDYDMWGDDFGAFDLIDRRNGLVIGDEFIFHGTNPANDDYYAGVATGFRTGRPKGYFAVPPANVKGGTVVTTFGATHWKDQQNVDNPYKDYATTIALQPGDTVGGKAVGGRVFISFTEQPNRFNHSLPADILPGSEWDNGTAVWPNTYVPDTEAQRNWDFSGTRWVVGNTSLGGRLVETTVTMPDGSTFIARSTGSGSGLVSANYTKLFGTAYLPRWDMTRRGLWWVGRGERANEGDVRIAAEPMVATAAMPEPVVVAQRDAGYVAEPMRALAQMPRVAESEVGDVEIVTLPWTATADWTGFSRVISAEPMLATAELVENFDMVHASGEQVVLTLHGVDATLYLKEED